MYENFSPQYLPHILRSVLVTFNEVNAYDLVSADNMIITEAALTKLEEVLTRE